MTSRINTKFVVLLIVGLVVVVGVAVGGVILVRHLLGTNAEEDVNRGKALMDRGMVAKAYDYFGRAVNKRPADPEILSLYIDALSQLPCGDISQATQNIIKLRQTLKKLVSLDPSNTKNLDRNMRFLMRLATDLGDTSAWKEMHEQAGVIRRSNPNNLIARKYDGIAVTNTLMLRDVSIEERTAAEQDLRAALGADAGDLDVLQHLGLWYAMIRVFRFKEQPHVIPQMITTDSRTMRVGGTPNLRG